MSYSVLSRYCGQCGQNTRTLLNRLRHQIVIEQPSAATDANGQMVETWSTFATVMAAVEPLQGREFFAAQQENDETTVRIRIRYIAGVTADMRVSFNSKLYNIRAIINPQERNQELQLMCTVGVNNG